MNPMSLPELLPLAKAAEKFGVSEFELRAQIEAGTILAGILPNGEIVVSMSNGNKSPIESSVPKEQLPEYEKHSHLRGVGIGISDAARMYALNRTTVIKWVQAGYIRNLGQDGQKVLIDQADVAYCAEIYHQRGGVGKWLFNPDGTPYKLKYPNKQKID